MRLVSIPYTIRLTDCVKTVSLYEMEAITLYDWLKNPDKNFNLDELRPDGTIVRAYWDEIKFRECLCLRVGDVVLEYFKIERFLHELEVVIDELQGLSSAFVEDRPKYNDVYRGV